MKKKIFLIVSLIIGIISLFIGTHAYYRISITNNINAKSGNAIFILKDSNNNDLNNKVIALNDGNKVFPGDSGLFTITLDASGSSEDMYATLEIDRGNLPTNLKFYTTSDKKSELHKYYSFLEKNKTTSETLTIYWYWNPYIDDIEDSKFVNKSNLEATIKVDVKQIGKYATMKNGYSKDETMSGGTEIWNDTYRPYIRTITFDSNLTNLPANCTEENLCFDITESGSSEKVYGYLIDSGLKDTTNNTKSLYNLYIVSESPIFAPTGCYRMFYNFNNLISIEFNDNFNTSNTINMGAMFCNSGILPELDLSTFNTSRVNYMVDMFGNCISLINVNLESFNTSKIAFMWHMFCNCKSLTSLDLSSFNTSNVLDMAYVFAACGSLTELNLSSFDTSKVTTMNGMFKENNSLVTLKIDEFNTSNVTNMVDMFYSCQKLTTLDLSNFNTSNVTTMYNMFANSKKLSYLNISTFNTSKVENIIGMFYNCSSLSTTINIMNTSMSYDSVFTGAATNENSKIIVNYISDASTLIDNVILTKSSNSNVEKGSQI